MTRIWRIHADFFFEKSVQIRQIRVIRVLFAVQFLPKLAHRVTIKEQFA